MTYELTILSNRPAALWNVATFTDITGNGFLATPTGTPASYNSLVAGGGFARVLTNATPVNFEAPVFRPKPFTLEAWFKPQNLDPSVETTILGQENFGIFATSLQIIGRIELETSEIYEVTYDLSPWKTAVHVALTFDLENLALYVDGEEVSVNLELEDIGKHIAQQTIVDTIRSGVSASASEIVIDSPAIYGYRVPGDVIQNHFTVGRRVMNAGQVVAQSGGNMIRLSDNNANVYQSVTFETDEQWANGTYENVNIGDDRLTAEVDGTTLAGEWHTVVELSSETADTIDAIKLGWLGSGVTVDVSLDGTIWTTLDENEPLVPISLNTSLIDLSLEIKVNFTAGLSEAYLTRLRVIAYRDLTLVGERGVDAEFLPAVLAEQDFEPIEDYDDRGLQYGPLIIEEEVDWETTNLVLNGDASDGNTNFTDATYNADAPSGASGSFLVAQEDFEADEYIAVDSEVLNGEFYLKQSAGSATVSGGLAAYDVDQNRILPENFMYYADTTTVMSSDLTEGDTHIYLEDVTNWPDATPRSDEGRGFIAWNWLSSEGIEYDNYSRNVYTNLYSSGAVDALANSIELDVPWAGPTIPAGTRVNSYRSSGDEIIKFIADEVTSTSSWVLYEGDLIVHDFTGDVVHNSFWPGTHFVRPAWHIAGGTAQLIGGVKLRIIGETTPRTLQGLELWIRFEDTPVGTVVDNGEQIAIVAGELAATAGTLIINGDPLFSDPIVPLRWYHVIWEFPAVNEQVVIGSNAALTDDAPIQIGQVATYENPPLDNYDLYQGLPSLVITEASGIVITSPSAEVKIYDPDWSIVASG